MHKASFCLNCVFEEPLEPGSIGLISRSTNNFTISWTSAGSFDGFNVYMNDLFQIVTSQTVFTAPLSLLSGNRYIFKVNAYRSTTSFTSSNVTATFYTSKCSLLVLISYINYHSVKVWNNIWHAVITLFYVLPLALPVLNFLLLYWVLYCSFVHLFVSIKNIFIIKCKMEHKHIFW